MSARNLARWSEAHRQQAIARTYEIAARLSRLGPVERERARALASSADGTRPTCWQHWLEALMRAGLTMEERDREARRVDRLAMGRLVRETIERWSIQYPDGGRTHGHAKDDAIRIAKQWGGATRAIRITTTRIRKATP